MKEKIKNINRQRDLQPDDKAKRADEPGIQHRESDEKASELELANEEIAFQNEEKEKRASELVIANTELAFQDSEKEKRAFELVLANKELAFQNEEKEKRAAELIIANKELVFQNGEKEKRASELIIANKELAFQNDEKEKRAAELVIANKELKRIYAYQQNVREEERKYIAREVHDELGQLASALKIDIDWLSIKIPSIDENVLKRIAHANKIIEVLITSVRKIASNLRPSILDDFGLNAALIWHCDEFHNLNGIECTFIPGFVDTDLTTHQKTELYRIAQESLTNIMRHAKATKVTVAGKEDAQRLYITITDNGVGFDAHNQKSTLGLIGLRERALSLDGELDIVSEIGGGTVVTVVIPK